MGPTKKEYFIGFTILGLSMVVMSAFSAVGGLLYGIVGRFIIDQEAGVFRWLSWLFLSDWTGILVQYVFVLGIPYGIAWLVMRPLKKVQTPAKKLTLEEFLICLVTAAGMGYLFNLGGTAINLFFGMFTQKTMDEMNPVFEAMADMTPGMVIYVCILGPFMEEVMFRGMLLRRARRFGDRTAVVYCAVLFGLMHGNLTQFLYAAFVGLVLGYVAVKTGKIRYNALLHIAFNSYSTLITVGLDLWDQVGLYFVSGLYSLAILAGTLLLIIGAVFFLHRHWRWASWELSVHNGQPSTGKKYAYLNPGFLLYAALCGAEMLGYLF